MNRRCRRPFYNDWRWTMLLHIFGCMIYMIPLTFHYNSHSPNLNQPVLDESHVCSADNVDVNGPSSLVNILRNDYWGRPMTAEHSHKSWRPFTILSLRYLGGAGGRKEPKQQPPLTTYARGSISTLTLHRFVNVVLHAVTADLVAILATRLFVFLPSLTPLPQQQQQQAASFLLYVLTKLLFLLHPTHVEVTANAANRNHLFATFFSLILILLICDVHHHSRRASLFSILLRLTVWMPLVLVLAFSASETFLFQIPAILVTTTVVEFAKQQQLSALIAPSSSPYTYRHHSSSPFILLYRAWYHQLPVRHGIVLLGAILYVYGRHYFNTLTIPRGLLRPAENPFAHLTGWSRVWNYSYVTALHIMKSIGLDVIGFSHEYGERCIEPLHLVRPSSLLTEMTQSTQETIGPHFLLPMDVRFLLVIILAVLLVAITVYCFVIAFSTHSTPPTTSSQPVKQQDEVNKHCLEDQNDVNPNDVVDDDKNGNNDDDVVDNGNHDNDVVDDDKNGNNDNDVVDDDKNGNNDNQPEQCQHENILSEKEETCNNLRENDKRGRLFPLLLWCTHLSWLLTLFPITGFVKVGTFISDRIVVPSTVSTCILLGAFLTKLLLSHTSLLSSLASTEVSTIPSSPSSSLLPTKRNNHRRTIPVLLIISLMFGYMWRRIHVRSLQWMDSVPLLESSLRTCPNFAKGHLEISKVYSGLYSSLFNLTKSRWHLEQVQRIDPTYCDVHQQFAHVAIQEMQYMEFEEQLAQAITCPFTMGGAVEMWKRYWQAVLSGPGTTEVQRRKAQARHDKYTLQIQQYALEQQRQEEQ